MILIFKYILFCIISTLVNLLTQRIFLDFSIIEISYFFALVLGSITGLLTKYLLDKNYIFIHYDYSFRSNSKQFTAYTLNGVITTLIFWVTESLFLFIYATPLARELGAVIGLSIGYCIKYKLDKRYVFEK